MGIQRLEDKSLAVWGFGREGKAALTALNHRFPGKALTLIVPEDDRARVVSEVGISALEVVNDRELDETLRRFEVVLKSPGISPYRAEVRTARACGVEFVSGTQLWFEEHAGEHILCITGTKGKSTTATLLAQLLEASGSGVELGGNIGRPLLTLLDPEPRPDMWVIELSSFQTFDLDVTAEVAVLLNLHPEHLDWHGNVGNYYSDKLRIFAGQGPGSAVLNHLDSVTTEHLPSIHGEKLFFNHLSGVHTREGAIWDGDSRLCSASKFPLPGEHNLSNLCAALTVLKAVGSDLHDAIAALPSLRGLKHRLEAVASKRGLLFVDDAISTTPQSAIAALRCYSGRPTTILVGGFDRGLDWTEFADSVLCDETFAVLALPDSGSKIADLIRLRQSKLDGESRLRLHTVESLEAAVRLAAEITPREGVVLLSPGAPSFGRFHDYEERGAAFARAVAEL